MANIDIYKVLSYGAIGLSCILAIAAYFLLRKEQDKKSPRKQILTSIYVFMFFSFVLTISGFVREIAKDKNSLELESIKNTNAEKLKSARDIVRIMVDQKQGKIAQLSALINDGSGDYRMALQNIVDDLKGLDGAMSEVIADERTK